MKKRILSILLIFALLVMCLSGCKITTGTIDDLLAPPDATDGNQGLVKVLEEKVSAKTTFSSPKYGEYRSSVITKDIDGDGVSEALAFYYKVGKKNKINMMLFKHVKNDWISIQNIEGQGTDIYSIDFPDFNNDGVLEIAVGWSSDTNKDKRIMTVYSYDSKLDEPMTTAFANILYSMATVVDFNSDEKDELLFFNTSSRLEETIDSFATLYGYDESDNFALMGEARMDNNVTSYTNVFVQQDVNDDGVTVYVDGTKGDSIMVTEIVRWDEKQRTLVAPLYDASVSATVITSRGVRVATRDINDDKIAEIPIDHSLVAESDKKTYLVRWKQVVGRELVPVKTSLINLNDGNVIHIDDGLSAKIFVEYSVETKEWSVKSWDLINNIPEGELFTIKTVSRAQWKMDKASSDYTELLYNGRSVYIGKVQKLAEDYNITIDYLLNNISIY